MWRLTSTCLVRSAETSLLFEGVRPERGSGAAHHPRQQGKPGRPLLARYAVIVRDRGLMIARV